LKEISFVVDQEGDPVVGVTVSCEEWNFNRRHNFTRVTKTDADGSFQLDRLPLRGTFGLAFNKKGYLNMSVGQVSVRKEPYEVTLYHPPVIRGKVVDMETKEPMNDFEVTCGYRWVEDGLFSYRHNSPVSITGSAEGAFALPCGRVILGYPPNVWFTALIPKAGYYPETTPAYLVGDPTQTYTVQLERGKGVSGKVVDRDGESAPQATVCWIGPNRNAYVRGGQIDRTGFTNQVDTKVQTADDGSFELPPRKENGHLFVIHDKGYFFQEDVSFLDGSSITLIPWAKIEGYVKVGNEPLSEHPIRINVDPNLSQQIPITWIFRTTTHIDGKYSFDHVPSVPMRIGRATGRGDLSHSTLLTPQPGQPHTINIGGSGKTAVGSITFDSTDEKTASLKNQFQPESLRAHAVPLIEAGRPVDSEDKFAPTYVADVDQDGNLQINDLPAGDYLMIVDMHAPRLWNTCGANLLLASAKARFTVDGARDNESLLLPDLVLKPVPRPEVGDEAPAIEGNTLNGQSFALRNLRGKYVLLDFWATWCGPCVAEIPKVKRIHETYSSTKKFEVVGVNFDHQTNLATTAVERNKLDWTHVSAGAWKQDHPIGVAYGVPAMPSFWLIGPEGRVLGRDIDPSKLESFLENHVPSAN